MYREHRWCGTKPAVVRDRDDRSMENILYVAVLWQITLSVNTILTNLRIPDDSGQPKAWAIAFVYMLLMGGCTKIKPVSAAVQKALQI